MHTACGLPVYSLVKQNWCVCVGGDGQGKLLQLTTTSGGPCSSYLGWHLQHLLQINL